MFDGRSKFKVRIACGTSLHHTCTGNFIALSAMFLWWVSDGTNCIFYRFVITFETPLMPCHLMCVFFITHPSGVKYLKQCMASLNDFSFSPILRGLCTNIICIDLNHHHYVSVSSTRRIWEFVCLICVVLFLCIPNIKVHVLLLLLVSWGKSLWIQTKLSTLNLQKIVRRSETMFLDRLLTRRTSNQNFTPTVNLVWRVTTRELL